jgi:hypothetical protein
MFFIEFAIGLALAGLLVYIEHGDIILKGF